MAITYRAPEPDEMLEYRTKLFENLWELTWKLSDRDRQARPPGPGDASLTLEERRDAHLALLNSIGVTYALLDFYEKESAARAGRLGAGYPDLAEAWRITRQGARRRWPEAAVAFDEAPLRRALTAVVMAVSNNRQLDPRTAGRLIGPVATAATAMVNGTADQVAAAAREIVDAGPPAPPDSAVMSPLIDALRQALDEYDADPIEDSDPAENGAEPSTWSKFLTPRKR
jgi:hypothetical protein